MYEQYIQYLTDLHNISRHRKLPELVNLNTKHYLDFSTNDYLALSKNKEVLNAAMVAASKYGAGSTGSRLLSGNNALFENFEKQIAKDKKEEAALIFSSGFQANFSVLSSLLDAKVLGVKPLVFFDKLNHSSLYQAVFLSGAELIRYHHNDMTHLSTLLNKYKNDSRAKFIVSETIFGMDGDIVDINEITTLALKYQAFLYLDEAHATGIIGDNGYGLSSTVSLRDIPHLIMGTFSKALGCSGGYVACSNIIKDYLINKAPGFIYSTAKSPMVVGAASEAWKLVKNFGEARAQLLSLSKNLKERLNDLGFNTGTSSTHIIPIILGKEELAIAVKEKLAQDNIIVSCARPPTVPIGLSRIRLALNVTHNINDIERLVENLMQLQI